MKKDGKPNVWKNGMKELILVFSILFIASVLTIFLAVLLPKIPLEGAVLLAGVILFVVLGAIALTVYIIKEIKNKN
jgi:hypothetical protein